MFGLKTPIFQQFLKPFPEQTIWVSFTATKTELLWLQTMYFCVHFLLLYILANDKTPKLRVNKKNILTVWYMWGYCFYIWFIFCLTLCDKSKKHARMMQTYILYLGPSVLALDCPWFLHSQTINSWNVIVIHDCGHRL